MGFSISWLAVQGKPRQAILAELGLRDTGEVDEVNEAEMSGAELPGGWYVLFLNDVLHPFVDPKAMARLSQGCLTVACQVEEHVMASAAYAWRDGAELWSTTHEADLGPRHLLERGQFPEAYARVKAELGQKQDASDQGGRGVDYIWDIPVTLAWEVVGYRHDQTELKTGEGPVFHVLATGP